MNYPLNLLSKLSFRKNNPKIKSTQKKRHTRIFCRAKFCVVFKLPQFVTEQEREEWREEWKKNLKIKIKLLFTAN